MHGKGSEDFFQLCMTTLDSSVRNMQEETRFKYRQAQATKRSGNNGLSLEQQKEGNAFVQRTDNKWVEIGLLLRMLTNCVQGHNLPFANFLREQHTNKQSFNLILKAESVLNSLVSEGLAELPTDRSIGVQNTIKALTELIGKCMEGPCDKNQVLLATSEFAMIIQQIVKCGSETTRRSWQQDPDDAKAFIKTQELQISGLYALLGMLDGTVEDEVAMKLLPNIQVHELLSECLSAGCWAYKFPRMAEMDSREGQSAIVQEMNKMKDIGEDFGKIGLSRGLDMVNKTADLSKSFVGMEIGEDALPALIKSGMNLEFDKVLLLWTFLQAARDVDYANTTIEPMIEHTVNYHTNGQESWGGPLVKRKIQELHKSVNSIEIFRGDRVFRLHFPVPSICLKVTKMSYFTDHFNLMMDSVQPRDNPSAKAASLLCRLQDLADEMAHYHMLLNHVFTNWLVKMRGHIEVMPFNIAAIKSILIIVTYGAHDSAYTTYDNVWYITVVFLEWVQVAACAAFCLSYFVVVAPTAAVEPREPSISVSNGSVNENDDPMQALDDNEIDFGEDWETPPDPPTGDFDIFTDCNFIYEVLCLPMAWWSLTSLFIAILSALPAGYVTNNYTNNFIGVLILLDYCRLPGGAMVIGSLRVGGKGLMSSFCVALILITIHGMGAFIFFEDEVNINNPCTTAYQCMYLAMDNGFRGDIADAHATPTGVVFWTMPTKLSNMSKVDS